ncbi:MAG: DUF4215 domain-containing protein, partial [Firmicutes bacterium]|nr:DUF4215 domain-containing protein [Bacillota bacterium]
MADGKRVFTYVFKDNILLKDKSYRINVYENGFIVGKSPSISEEVVIKDFCQLNDIRIDVWPRGQESYSDNFFCVGDDCGKNTEDLYDNDVSSSWSTEAPDDNYDFPYIWSLTGGNIDDDANRSGNQHLYQAYGVNQYGYLIKVDDFNWKMEGTPQFDFSTSDFTDSSNNYYSSYDGIKLINLNSANIIGAINGNNILTVSASQGFIEKLRDVNITVFLCNNPWPEPNIFPYQDKENNCTNGDCKNTNFEIYYCRDRGVLGKADDLPKLDYGTVVIQNDPWKKEFLLQRDDNNDAVGIRVLPNGNYFSPLLWYYYTFDPDRRGTPQSMVVDGYQAIREGRTVYVNSINIDEYKKSHKLHPDIYLISYNEGAESDTKEIYNQMLNYMKFNTGVAGEIGALNDLGVCSSNNSIYCLIDSDCELVNAGYCNSDKAKLIRDTKRLADVQDINYLLDNYYNISRCSNDPAITCYNNGQCYGGGVCGNYYPNLSAGTYVSGHSFSVWPSWQATLGNVLGSGLPIDPINKLYGCSEGYNSETCWNDQSKDFACPSDLNVYAYFTEDKGQTKKVVTKREYPLSGTYDMYYVNIMYMNSNPFHIDSSYTFCSSDIATCGNNVKDEGENCYNCPFDAGCTDPNKTCRQIDDGWVCSVDTSEIDSDGDGFFNYEDLCPFIDSNNNADTDGDKIGDICDNCSFVLNGSSASSITCDISSSITRGMCNQSDRDGDGIGDACDTCIDIYDIYNSSSSCSCGDGIIGVGEICDDGNATDSGYCNEDCSGFITVCGNGIKEEDEECDDSNNISNDGCSSTCKIEIGSVITSYCGDGIKDDGEQCDCGDGIGPLYLPSNCGNVNQIYTTYNIPETASLDFYFNPFWRLDPQPLYYCKAETCTTSYLVPSYCGDGEWNSDFEQCDYRVDNGSGDWGLGINIDNQYYCNGSCQDYGGWCGDGETQSLKEVCDFGDNNNINCPEWSSEGIPTTCQECSESCQTLETKDVSYCGDGVVNLGYESCEGERTNMDIRMVFAFDTSKSLIEEANDFCNILSEMEENITNLDWVNSFDYRVYAIDVNGNNSDVYNVLYNLDGSKSSCNSAKFFGFIDSGLPGDESLGIPDTDVTHTESWDEAF